MRKLLWILLFALVLPCLGVEPQQIVEASDEMLMWMDKYTWETYTNPYTGETVEITAAERQAIKVLAIAKYNEHKAAVLLYAQEIGIIN